MNQRDATTLQEAFGLRPFCVDHPKAKVVVSSLRNFLYCKVCKKVLKEGDCDEAAS